ncbi:MAG: hypothetical protein E6G94_12745 [Alphaproteobacteria bacterium]|nr:MAG: hypothetical protein E6G94_12745 [Alphaproteobacteria bacterium]
MGIGEFAKQSVSELRRSHWLLFGLLFLLFLGGTNALLALHQPHAGEKVDPVFIAAGIVRVVALVVFSVAALRTSTASPRGRWTPDCAFWLYFGLTLLALIAPAIGGVLALRLPEIVRILVSETLGILLVLPLTVWTVAAAVERPLALAPRFQQMGRWLPPLLVLALLLVLPLAILHAWDSLKMLLIVGHEGFWPLALLDAVVSTALVLVSLALKLTAYRSVA